MLVSRNCLSTVKNCGLMLIAKTTLFMRIRKKISIKRFEILPWSVGRKDGSDMFLRISGADLFEAYYRTYTNMGTDKRNSHGKIVSLAKPNGVIIISLELGGFGLPPSFLMPVLFKILDFFNLLDESGYRISITNVAVIVLISKILFSSNVDWPSVVAVIVSFGNYSHKRYVLSKDTHDGSAIPEVSEKP
jgi:hypothetical protein